MMNIEEKEITIRNKRIQKNGKDYKLSISPDLINNGIIPREATYQVTIKSVNDKQIQIPFLIKKIQRAGENNYKILIPLDLITGGILPLDHKYDVVLKLLKQKLKDGVYKFDGTNAKRVGDYDDKENKETDEVEF